MSETRHTPGPWKVGFSDGSGMKYIVGKKEKFIAVIRWGCSCCENMEDLTDEEKANTRLIAAAPDLLAALKEIIADHKERMILYPKMNNQENRIRVMELAKAAIAKTEGKP